ncbi:MAG: DUF3552 domain-containing protein, partial [Clostridiales bacterium]|nr:DUF3552 domain-containing protein [Clostridiales bacterium]
MPLLATILISVAVLIIGLFIGFLIHKSNMKKKIGRAEEYAKRLLDEASQKADLERKEKLLEALEAKDEVLKLKTENDKEVRERRNELQRSERRIQQREESLDKKSDNLESREERLNKKQSEIQKLFGEAENYKEQQTSELERIAGLTQDEAKQILTDRIQKDAYHDAAAMIREIEGKAKEEGDKKARNIIALAIQKCASDHVAESTVSVITLPNDDMKGRIIGREGRNIRALETATGVDFIIDDTPEAVIISAFDPVRREIARLSV